MSLLREWWRRLAGTFGAGRRDPDLEEELRAHADMAAEDATRAGESRPRRAALIDHGAPAQVMETLRDQRGWPWLRAIGRDVRSAVRSLRATPGVTLVALLVLALGIGASTAIVSVVDAVLLRGLPFDEADRIVTVREVRTNGRATATSPQNFLDWQSRQDVVTALAALRPGRLLLRRDGGLPPESVPSTAVTANVFSVLRVPPWLGRTFTPDHEIEGRNRVAVLSYGFWQRRFGGAADVVGRQLPAADGDLQVVGVMPPGFTYPPVALEPTEVWTPYVVPEDQRPGRRGSHYWTLQLLGRLRDGVTIGAAQARFSQLTDAMIAADPQWFSGTTGALVQPLHESLTGDAHGWMVLLLAAVGFVLLLACANVANILLVRATTRARELGIRAALGATRGDLARALLVEGLMLSLAGAALGACVAWWGVEVLSRAAPASLPRLGVIELNGRVLFAAVAAAIGSGLFFGTAPAIASSRPALPGALKDAGRTQTSGSGRRLRTMIVMAEVAIAVVLLVGAVLFTASFSKVARVDLGVDVDRVITLSVLPPAAEARKRQRILEVVARVSALPGVEAAAAAGSAVPMMGAAISYDFQVAGQPHTPGPATMANRREVSPDYFRVLRLPLIAGRAFTDADRRDATPVCLLNAEAARAHFGSAGAAVGRAVEFGGGRREVVGVVGDVRQWGPEGSAHDAVFVPLIQSDITWATLLIRTTGDASSVLPAARALIQSEFPDAVIPNPLTLSGALDDLLAPRRFNMLLLGVFGLLGLMITALGIFGVTAYAVTQQTSEIGIRVALGAAPTQIFRSVVGRTAIALGVGLAVGLAGAWSLAGLVRTFLFQIEPHDPRLFAAAAATLMAIGLAASFLPARRASRVDPATVLRMD